MLKRKLLTRRGAEGAFPFGTCFCIFFPDSEDYGDKGIGFTRSILAD